VNHPFDLPDDFPFAELGREYATGQYKIDDIAAEYDISRGTFLAIRRAAPKTWTQEPPNLWWDDLGEAPEEIAEKAEAQRKVNEAEKKARRKAKREKEKSARKWDNLKQSLEEAAGRFEDWHEDYDPPNVNVRIGTSGRMQPAALVLPIHDLHYGKYATAEEVGADYDREIASKRAHTAVDAVLEQALRAAHIEKIITVCGSSDYLHIDQDTPAATTSGTPQHADGTMGEIIAGGQSLAVELVDKMRSVAPTEVVYCPGNHDFQASQWMHSFLEAYYRSEENVTFTRDRRTRQYFTYGVTKGCFFHGDVRKSQLKELGNTIAREHGFGEYTMAISGHKHFRKADDKSGLLMHQCPSLSGSDLWHDKNLYNGLPGLQAFVLDKEEGPVSTPTWYA
jgi:predicted phosphodiesterase